MMFLVILLASIVFLYFMIAVVYFVLSVNAVYAQVVNSMYTPAYV